ncbi:hypothetical protein [Kribbella endophytica]
MIKLFRRRTSDCRCQPQWPALVTEQNGYLMPCLPAEHGSIWTRSSGLTASCSACSATYPGNFVLEPGTPPPFDWARAPKNTVCSCEPQWPQLMVMLDGHWYLGYPGQGDHLVDGAAEEAFCRTCGAYFLAKLVIDYDDQSHLVDPEDP